MNNVSLKSIGADYILELEYFNNEKTKKILGKITQELIKHARKIVDSGFKDYIKSHEMESQIKSACLQYYIAIYLLISTGSTNSCGLKTVLRELITEHNDIGILLKDLQNLDFYMGGCGIDAQNIAIKSI